MPLIDHTGERGKPSAATTIWHVLTMGLVLLRVALVTATWLTIFLLIFFGYLTVPLFVLVGFALLYGTFRVLRPHRQPAGKGAGAGSAAKTTATDAGMGERT